MHLTETRLLTFLTLYYKVQTSALPLEILRCLLIEVHVKHRIRIEPKTVCGRPYNIHVYTCTCLRQKYNIYYQLHNRECIVLCVTLEGGHKLMANAVY